MEILLVREIVSHLNTSKSATPPVIINMVDPGLCKSTIDRNEPDRGLVLQTMRSLIERTTEVGSRTLVLAASAGPESHGGFMSDGKTVDVESWIHTDMGRRVQQKTFDQTLEVLEARKPGISEALKVTA